MEGSHGVGAAMPQKHWTTEEGSSLDVQVRITACCRVQRFAERGSYSRHWHSKRNRIGWLRSPSKSLQGQVEAAAALNAHLLTSQWHDGPVKVQSPYQTQCILVRSMFIKHSIKANLDWGKWTKATYASLPFLPGTLPPLQVLCHHRWPSPYMDI